MLMQSKDSAAGTTLARLITAQELADMMGVTLGTVYQWSHQGKLPKRVAASSSLLRFRREDVEAWLAGQAT